MARPVAIARVVICLLAASFAGGCAARGPRSQRFIERGPEAASDGQSKGHAELAGEPARGAPKESLESFIGKVRQLAATARPTAQVLPTLESRDADLLAAKVALAARPGADSQRRLAMEYMRVGVLDAAYDHFRAALRLEPTDAASFDGLARIWRDWGLPNLGLGDAHRAIYYAPASATVYNTLGTVLLSLGQTGAAQTAFEAALRRDPKAAYALNNLCYVKFLQGHSAEAIAVCNSALAAQPDLAAAHNNLALAYWVEGDRRSATEAFASMGSPGAVRYNTGIALLGSRLFEQAAEAFDDARTLSPALRGARQRALQAHTLAAGAIEGPR